MRIPSTVSDQYIYFVAVDSTDFTTRETGLSSFTVYRSRNGGAAAAMTTPTINETDSTNMPGVYELLLDEDMTIDSGDQSQEICFHITHAGMAPVTRTIEIYRPSVSLGNTIAVSGARANCDVVAVSGDTTAADNLEAAYDGTGYDVGGIDVSELNSIVDDLLDAGRLDALIDAIKAKTDSLTFTVAGNVDSNPQSWDDTLLAVTNPFDNVATSAALATVDSNVDAILVDTGTTIPGTLSDIQGATFSTLTDSLEAIRNRGDAAWITATGFSTHSAANVRTEMDSNSTQLAAIVADTNELQTDWADGGRLDLILDARASQTTADAIETDTQDIQSRIPAALVGGRIDATVDATGMEAGAVATIFTTAMTESYRGAGAAGTLAQYVHEIIAHLGESAISGTTKTLKQLDGSTTAKTYTLDDATTPTSITETT